VLDERERVKELCSRLQGEIEHMTEELIHEKREGMEFAERIKRLIGVNQYHSFGNGQTIIV
jgi:hypothetical protein